MAIIQIVNIVERIAIVCHEANRAFCGCIGDHSQRPWGEAEQWQRDSMIKGVEFALKNPNAGPSAQHDAWLHDKLEQGWKYGPAKDVAKREHPAMLPYHQLPEDQKTKDRLFRNIVNAFLVGA